MNEKDIYSILAQNIRKYRILMNLTQEELAEKANLHPSYIGQIERGTKKISILTLSKISKALNINISILLNEKEAKLKHHTKKGKIMMLLDEIPQPLRKKSIKLISNLVKLLIKSKKLGY